MPCPGLRRWQGARAQLALPNRTSPPGQPCALCPSSPRAPAPGVFLSLSQSHLIYLLGWAGDANLPAIWQSERNGITGKRNMSLRDMSLIAQERAEIPWDFPGALIHAEVT